MAYKGNAAAFRNRPTDPSNPFASYDFGPVPNDETHHISLSGAVDLPFGIKVAPILQYGSARPYDGIIGFDAMGVGSGRGNANIVVPVNSPNDFATFGSASGATIRACLAAATCKFIGFDSFRGSPTFQLDTRVSKTFKLGEKAKVEALTQLFNLTNRANFGNNYDGNLANTATFRQPLGFINPANTNIPRAFGAEFGFRFSF
jgi:hypothetical protein